MSNKLDKQLESILEKIAIKKKGLADAKELINTPWITPGRSTKLSIDKKISTMTYEDITHSLNHIFTIVPSWVATEKFLHGVEHTFESFDVDGYPVKSWLDDLLRQSHKISFGEKQKALEKLEESAKSLRSNEQKREQNITELAGLMENI